MSSSRAVAGSAVDPSTASVSSVGSGPAAQMAAVPMYMPPSFAVPSSAASLPPGSAVPAMSIGSVPVAGTAIAVSSVAAAGGLSRSGDCSGSGSSGPQRVFVVPVCSSRGEINLDLTQIEMPLLTNEFISAGAESIVYKTLAYVMTVASVFSAVRKTAKEQLNLVVSLQKELTITDAGGRKVVVNQAEEFRTENKQFTDCLEALTGYVNNVLPTIEYIKAHLSTEPSLKQAYDELAKKWNSLLLHKNEAVWEAKLSGHFANIFPELNDLLGFANAAFLASMEAKHNFVDDKLVTERELARKNEILNELSLQHNKLRARILSFYSESSKWRETGEYINLEQKELNKFMTIREDSSQANGGDTNQVNIAAFNALTNKIRAKDKELREIIMLRKVKRAHDTLNDMKIYLNEIYHVKNEESLTDSLLKAFNTRLYYNVVGASKQPAKTIIKLDDEIPFDRQCFTSRYLARYQAE